MTDALSQIDQLLADNQRQKATLLDLRAVIASERPSEPKPEPEFAHDDDDLVDTATASARFDIPVDTARWLCRKKGLGQKQGNRWLASVTAFRRYRERS